MSKVVTVLTAAAMALTWSANCNAQEVISFDKYKLIEYAVRSQHTDVKYGNFILQKPLGKDTYCGWIEEDFGKNSNIQIVPRLFVYVDRKELRKEAFVFIDRPGEISMFMGMVVEICHDAGYISARMPVGIYTKHLLQYMIPKNMTNNFSVLNITK